MSINRRAFIKQAFTAVVYGGFVGKGLIAIPEAEAAWIAEDFSPSTLTDVLIRHYQDMEITTSDQIILTLPNAVKSNTAAPVTVSSSLPKVSEISLWVAKNPAPLAVTFKLSPFMEAFVEARIKIAETGNVIAIVNADGKLYKARQEVEVKPGGCGGG